MSTLSEGQQAGHWVYVCVCAIRAKCTMNRWEAICLLGGDVVACLWDIYDTDQVFDLLIPGRTDTCDILDGLNRREGSVGNAIFNDALG